LQMSEAQKRIKLMKKQVRSGFLTVSTPFNGFSAQYFILFDRHCLSAFIEVDISLFVYGTFLLSADPEMLVKIDKFRLVGVLCS
jgi:hypothetical protein